MNINDFKDNDWWVENNDGTITFSNKGLEILKPIYEKMGINITSIKTAIDNWQAIRVCRTLLINNSENKLSPITRKAVLSIFNDDDQETERLKNLLLKKKALGLKVIK